MSRLSIAREVRKGRIIVVPSQFLGPSLIRRTGRGTWVNHFTETRVVHFEKDAGAAIKQVRRSQKVRTIHESVKKGNRILLFDFDNNHVRFAGDEFPSYIIN